MSNKEREEELIRKEKQELDNLGYGWFARKRLKWWRLMWLERRMKEHTTRIHSKPKHDSLVQRMVEHKQEVKALRKR